MICLIALVVFGMLSVFSAKYRSTAKEAFRCVFLKMSFRTCDTKLDQRIKSGIVSKLMKKNPTLARFVYRRFDVLSWIFTIVFFASMIYSFYSLYNLAVFGTCDPLTGSCVITQGSLACE